MTVVGRYFAMDRDRRWDRTKKAWDAIVLGRGEFCQDAPWQALTRHYSFGVTDEFMPPLIFSEPDSQRVKDGDVFCFLIFGPTGPANSHKRFCFKTSMASTGRFGRGFITVTLTQYDVTYPSPFVFRPQELDHILGQVVSAAGKSQLRIAETEKYAHVTYFFNGGIETAFAGEDRKIVPSPKVATYDLQPEMSAPAVTDEVVARLANYDLVVLNFANPDMVGHTGVVAAGIKAVETVDRCVARIVSELLRLDGKCLVTADHGNCEQMRNPDGSPNTAHTTNLVHCIYVAKDAAQFQCQDGILADVAPTLLFLLGLPQPTEMTGRNLLGPKR